MKRSLDSYLIFGIGVFAYLDVCFFDSMSESSLTWTLDVGRSMFDVRCSMFIFQILGGTQMALLPEVKKHYGKLKFLINGEWVASKSTDIQETTNPATGK